MWNNVDVAIGGLCLWQKPKANNSEHANQSGIISLANCCVTFDVSASTSGHSRVPMSPGGGRQEVPLFRQNNGNLMPLPFMYIVSDGYGIIQWHAVFDFRSPGDG